MKKILLIEDRFKRQQLFMSATNIDLNKYSEVLDNFVEESYIEFELQLKNNNFKFDEYDYIISHQSAFNKDYSELNKLIEHCKQYDKTLILFSGGISVNYYDNSEYELLILNSKIFYSQNLVLFLEATKEGHENILMLPYGEQWQQNIVFNVIEKINLVLQRLDTQEMSNLEFESFIEIQKLTDINFNFYKTKVENNKVSVQEIKKLRDSLYNFIQHIDSSKENNQNALLIDNDNTDDELFSNRIKFSSKISDIDKYISKELIDDLKNREFHVVYIKDNLSSNYLELYGLRVAYHIRLSSNLDENKRFSPIFIISDFTSDILNKFEPMANILFTKNIYLIENSTQAIKKALHLDVKSLTIQEYKEEFLNKIEVKQPKDYLTHHSIANEWAINRWANVLDIKSEALEANNDKISSMLYFKYLLAKNPIEKQDDNTVFAPKKKGNILFIDDEWNHGWSDILKKLFEKNQNIIFDVFEYDFKDKSNFNLIMQLKYKNLKDQIKKADVVILDLRLIEQDHDIDTDTDNYSGIKILQKIHEINEGIQVVMLTATSKSTILEKLYEYKILGYIKKEHPDDISIDTKENIEKFVKLIDKGLKNSYLKEIWNIQNSLLGLEIFQDIEIHDDMSIEDEKLSELKNAIPLVFVILDSNIEDKEKFKFTVLAIYKCFEIICDYFLDETKENQRYIAYWREDNQSIGSTATSNKLKKIFDKFDILSDENEKQINKIACTRNYIVHSENISRFCQNQNRIIRQIDKTYIVIWFKLLETITSNI